MVEGRLGKFYKEVVLLEQEYIVEDKAGDVSKVLKKASADLGAEVTAAQLTLTLTPTLTLTLTLSPTPTLTPTPNPLTR